MGNSQHGYVSMVLISLIATVALLLGAIGFGVWAFMERQDYKNHSDQKAAAAAEEAKKATEATEAARYAEEAKNPLTTHKAPDEFGGVTVAYPKTWSGYVIENTRGGTAVDNYFHPSVVSDVGDRDNTYALRVQVVNQAYDRVIASYENDIDAQRLKASPYTLPKVPDEIGTRFDGEVEDGRQGSMVVLPVRNMTLKVWTASSNFLADFNNIILPNLTYSP